MKVYDVAPCNRIIGIVVSMLSSFDCEFRVQESETNCCRETRYAAPSLHNLNSENPVTRNIVILRLKLFANLSFGIPIRG